MKGHTEAGSWLLVSGEAFVSVSAVANWVSDELGKTNVVVAGESEVRVTLLGCMGGRQVCRTTPAHKWNALFSSDHYSPYFIASVFMVKEAGHGSVKKRCSQCAAVNKKQTGEDSKKRMSVLFKRYHDTSRLKILSHRKEGIHTKEGCYRYYQRAGWKK